MGLLAGGCVHGGQVPPGPRADLGRDEITADFFKAPLPEHDRIQAPEAEVLARAAFDQLDRSTRGLGLHTQPTPELLKECTAELRRRPALDRAAAAEIVTACLARSGISHVYVLTPTTAQQLFTAAPSPTTAAPPHITTTRESGVGILSVPTFLVPHITREQVAQAVGELESAPKILIDLRGNAGGSVSSISYAAQHFLPPGAVVCTTRYGGVDPKSRPFVQNGPLPDSSNPLSKADLALTKHHGAVEWRTPGSAQRYPGRVYLLVDRTCESSCEIFAAALQTHGVKVLGAKTPGSVLSASAFRSPWQGYLFVMPVANVLSASGATLEGRGVQPDVALPVCEAPSGREDRCRREALARIVEDR